MRIGVFRGMVVGLALALSPLAVAAQIAQGAQVAPPDTAAPAIAIIDQERMLTGSRYGQRIQQEVEEAGAALVAENRRIEAQLSEEELRLTALRATMPADEFRPLAQDFNQRVEGIRAAQEAKSRALQAQAEAARVQFFELAFPVLVDLMRMRGAVVLMDNRAVLLSVEGIDITEAAILRIDTEIGAGGDAPLIDLDGTRRAPSQTESTTP
ncbi:OmpH family outer membrane protein [Roseicyclus sp.]|uniref:OmpH family outer membrane protein n=1 Tax=Roseicyclus sp. TaxID=1914329 RepID=UPI003F6DA0F2